MKLFFPIFLILYEFCTNMSNDMYLPALPKISEDFLVSANLVQLTIAAWLAGNTAVQLFVGPLSDRFGRRPILFGGGLLFLLSTLGCALAPTLSLLILSRFIQGIGVCTMMVAGYASIHDLYDDKKAIHILVWMGSAAVIAPAIGPVLGGFILTLANWRAIFYTLFFLSLLALALLWFTMPESTQTKHRLSFAAITRTYKEIILNLPFMTSAAAFGLLYSGIIGWITASPFLLIKILKISPLEFGWLQVPVFGAYIIGAQMVKPLLEKIGAEKLIFFGLSLALLSGGSLFSLALLFESSVLSLILPISGYMLGFGFAAAPLNRTTLNHTTQQRGAAMALFYLTMTGSGTLVSLLLSLFNENALTTSLVISACIALAFSLNLIRQKC